MEFVEKILYKKVNNGDLLNIDREIFKGATGGGQTYFDLGGIDENELVKFLEYGMAKEKEEPESFENRKKYFIDVIKLGDGSKVAPLEFDPRRNRKNYKISDQRNNRHPAWLASAGFPTIPQNARYASDITNIPNLYIYIVKTSKKKYYAGFINNKLPIYWDVSLGLERLLTWDKHDSNKGFIDFEDKKVVFNNDTTSTFKLIKNEENNKLIQNADEDIVGSEQVESVIKENKGYYINSDVSEDDDSGEEDVFELDFDNLEFEEYDTPFETKKAKPKERKKSIPKKTNYEKKSRRNKKKGDLGEEAVVIMEQQKFILLGREDLAKSVVWVSKTKGDGLGYDIKSWDIVGESIKEKYIEVKTTVGGIDTPFDISDTEVNVSKELGERYYIYRVFGLEKINSKIKYYMVNGDVEEYFNLKPTSYKAYLKTE